MFKSYGKVCRSSLICGKMEETTEIETFNKLTMFQYIIWSVFVNYTLLRAHFFIAYCY